MLKEDACFFITSNMTSSQIVSRQRVADHGEVYTHEREVNAMLDLVAEQTQRIDARFLEPACGTGNFLVEILRRKLDTVARQHKKIQLDYERHAIIALASLYGIELLADNAAACRERLHDIFADTYRALFPKSFKEACLQSARYILSQNILCGDALTLKTDSGEDIIFPEWSAVNGSLLKRRDYVFHMLVSKASERELPLFSDLGKSAFVPDPLRDYPPVHFLEIGRG